jgi:hypothetical protein
VHGKLNERRRITKYREEREEVNPSPATSSSNGGEDRAVVLGITGGRVREGVMRVQTGERERELGLILK